MSSKLSRSMAGVRSAAAGWYMAKTERVARAGRRIDRPDRAVACEIRAPGMNVPIE